jgi:hypothetical protein
VSPSYPPRSIFPSQGCGAFRDSQAQRPADHIARLFSVDSDRSPCLKPCAVLHLSAPTERGRVRSSVRSSRIRRISEGTSEAAPHCCTGLYSACPFGVYTVMQGCAEQYHGAVARPRRKYILNSSVGGAHD